MSKTTAERSRAKRVRAAERRGEASEVDIAWLRAYEAPRAGQVGSEPSDAPRERPTTVEPDASGTWVPIDDEPEPAEPPPPKEEHRDPDIGPAPTKCTIPKCPACEGRNKPGPQRCATTGELVWPPLSMSAARGMAGGFFWVLGIAMKFWHKTPDIVEPTTIERDELARAIIEITRRRWGALAAVDDFLSAGWSVGSYLTRARGESRKLVADTGGKS